MKKGWLFKAALKNGSEKYMVTVFFKHKVKRKNLKRGKYPWQRKTLTEFF